MEFESFRGAWSLMIYHTKVLIAIVYSQEIRDSDHKLFERGRGNVCSVEVWN
jgi:hypothetical protein